MEFTSDEERIEWLEEHPEKEEKYSYETSNGVESIIKNNDVHISAPEKDCYIYTMCNGSYMYQSNNGVTFQKNLAKTFKISMAKKRIIFMNKKGSYNWSTMNKA